MENALRPAEDASHKSRGDATIDTPNSANKMAKALYDVENLDTQTFKFTVRPLPLYGPVHKCFRIIGLLTVFAILFGATSERHLALGIVVTAVAAILFFFINKAATKGLNRGRRFTQFTISPTGITFLENGASAQTLPRTDIERMYITAPRAGETVIHSAFGTGGSYTGISNSGGVSSGLAARSWQVVVQARGEEHWLGGGLTEPMASSLSTQVQRALSASGR